MFVTFKGVVVCYKLPITTLNELPDPQVYEYVPSVKPKPINEPLLNVCVLEILVPDVYPDGTTNKCGGAN